MHRSCACLSYRSPAWPMRCDATKRTHISFHQTRTVLFTGETVLVFAPPCAPHRVAILPRESMGAFVMIGSSASLPFGHTAVQIMFTTPDPRDKRWQQACRLTLIPPIKFSITTTARAVPVRLLRARGVTTFPRHDRRHGVGLAQTSYRPDHALIGRSAASLLATRFQPHPHRS